LRFETTAFIGVRLVIENHLPRRAIRSIRYFERRFKNVRWPNGVADVDRYRCREKIVNDERE